MIAASGNLPMGLAFEINDLLRLRGWADLHAMHMEVRLDHGAEDEEYEEVIVCHTDMSPPCRSIIWRNAEAVFVQPLVGRRLRFRSVNEALESLLTKRGLVLTDITATAWPAV